VNEIRTADLQPTYVLGIDDRLAEGAAVLIPGEPPDVLAVIGEVDAWASALSGVIGTDNRLCEYAAEVNQNWFNRRKVKFERVVGAGRESPTTLVYRLDEALDGMDAIFKIDA
jgi:hypothetical protein